MPDISMCSDDRCPSRSQCYRHEDSGTKPSSWQTYQEFRRPTDAKKCGDFLPARQKKEKANAGE